MTLENMNLKKIFVTSSGKIAGVLVSVNIISLRRAYF